MHFDPHPSFGNVDSVIPIDVAGMKSYMDGLFEPTCVPVGVKINKLNLSPNRNMPRFNRDSGIDIPEAWIPTVKQHNSRFMKIYEGTPSNDRINIEVRNAPITAYQRAANSDT